MNRVENRKWRYWKQTINGFVKSVVVCGLGKIFRNLYIEPYYVLHIMKKELMKKKSGTSLSLTFENIVWLEDNKRKDKKFTYSGFINSLIDKEREKDESAKHS